MTSIIYLLCGLPGSGKTTWAKKKEREGIRRFSLDEEVFARFGRHAEEYPENERKTKEAIRTEVLSLIEKGESAIVDYGFWKKSARDEYKNVVEQNGGSWQLLYFKVLKDELLNRLKRRNESDPTNNHIIDEQLFEKFWNEFEEPDGEGEEVIIM